MSLNNATPRVEMELHLSREAGETFLKIVQSVDSLQSMVQSIAAATEAMSSVSERGSNDVQGIAHSSRRNVNCSVLAAA